MDLSLKIFLVYIILINVVAIAVCIADKCFAKLKKYRISERTLLLLCVIGGSVGMYACMRIIRHKTRHNKFMLGIPIIFLLQIVALLFIFQKLA